MLYTRLFMLVSTILVSACCTAGGFAVNNPYNLAMEGELNSDIRRNEIQSYWEDRREGTFKGVGGIPLRYGYTLREDAKGVIVIVNGLSETFLKYKETAYDLHNQGYSIYMYDHRGQGLSGRILKNSQAGYVEDFNNYVLDLKKFYREVVSGKDKDNIYLLAHSMGGAIAALYMERYPDDFRAAVLASPMMEINTGIIPTAFTCNMAKWLHGLMGLMNRSTAGVPFSGSYESKPFSENRLTHSRIRYRILTAVYKKRPSLSLDRLSLKWVSEACRAGRIARQEAGRIKIPVLLLQAGQDKLVRSSGQKEFCVNLASGGKSRCPGGKPLAIKGAYHELFTEKDEYRIPALTATIDFLKAQREEDGATN